MNGFAIFYFTKDGSLERASNRFPVEPLFTSYELAEKQLNAFGSFGVVCTILPIFDKR